MESIKIPKTVTKIDGYDAFKNCTSLKEINVEEENQYFSSEQGVLFNKNKSVIGSYPAGKTDRYYIAPEETRIIQDYGFFSCSNLKTIKLPKGFREIKAYAFENSLNLTSVLLPESTTFINSCAFSGCSNLKKIVLPKSIHTFGVSVFLKCDQLTIYGNKGSEAEFYANRNGMPFVENKTFSIIENGQYNITVQDEETGLPIKDVSITCQEKINSTDSLGNASLNVELANEKTDVLLTAEKYQSKSLILSSLNPYAANVITLILETNIEDDIALNLPKISVGSDTIKGPVINVLGKEFNLFSTDNQVEIPLEPCKFKINSKEKTIECSIGISKSSELDLSPEKDKTSYQVAKDVVNKNGKGTDKNVTELWEGYELDKKDISAGFKIGGSVVGYLKWNYSSGETKLEDGGVILTGNADYGISYPLPPAPAIYVKLKFVGEAEGKINWIVTETNAIDYGLFLKANIKPRFGIGAGIDNIIGAEVGFEGNLESKIDVEKIMKKALLEDIYTASISGDFYLRLYALLFEHEFTYDYYDYELYPVLGKPRKQQRMKDNDTFKPISRDYLKNKRIEPLALSTGINETSVYPDGDPQMIKLDDGRLLAFWIADNKKKTDMNRTTLMYSIREKDNEEWSRPQSVYESERLDFSPKVYSDGNQCHIIWKNGAKEFNEQTTAQEMYRNMNLVYSVFDGTAFSEPTIIGNKTNEKLQVMESIASKNGRVSMSWVENSQNDPFMVSGTNTIYTQTLDGTWREPQVLQNSLVGLNSLAGGYLNDAYTLFYTKDGDGNIETLEDSELFKVDANGNVTQLTNDTVGDSSVSYFNQHFYCWTVKSL